MPISVSLPPPPFSKNSRLIVGVSGGADSLGLLCLLKEQLPKGEKQLVAAHVNYGLRGQGSQKDEEMVRHWCGIWQIPCRVLQVRSFKAEIKKGKKSPQEGAREIRYSYFLRLAKMEKAWGAAVAHHREDQAETVLDRLLRGAGARGLSGLRTVQTLGFPQGVHLRVWRPLLSYSKRQIQDYLESGGISWREDGSNRETKYRRNQIRHVILPFLSRWNPNLPEVLARVGELNAAEDIFLEGLLKPLERRVHSRWNRNTYTCNTLHFRGIPLALQRRWIRHVGEKLNPLARGLSFDRIEEILQIWNGKAKGPRDLGFGLTADRRQNLVILSIRLRPGTTGSARGGSGKATADSAKL